MPSAWRPVPVASKAPGSGPAAEGALGDLETGELNPNPPRPSCLQRAPVWTGAFNWVWCWFRDGEIRGVMGLLSGPVKPVQTSWSNEPRAS